MNIAISLGTGIVLFLCAFLGFAQGLRLGMNTAKGIIPEPIKSPVKTYKEHAEKKQHEAEVKKQDEEWQEVENYDGWTEEERRLNNKGVIE